MKRFIIISIMLCLLLLVSVLTVCGAESEEVTKSKIQGVWGIESMDMGMGENRRTVIPQAFMLFITENYYSSIRDFNEEPREDWGPGSESSTNGFMADAGTYELNGSEFVVYNKVAMIPNMMHGGSMAFECKMEGNDTLHLIPKYEKMNVPGMDIAPDEEGKMGYGDVAVLYRFKRLE